jgi:hypothetical protein
MKQELKPKKSPGKAMEKTIEEIKTRILAG